MAVQNMGRSMADAKATLDYVSDYQITMGRGTGSRKIREPSLLSWPKKASGTAGGSSCHETSWR